MKQSCKHRNAWIIASGYYLWCFECGALRRMEPSKKINGIYPVSGWCKPQKENPYEKWKKTFKDNS